MDIVWTNSEEMDRQTQSCFSKFDNIQEFFDIQNIIYTEYWATKSEKIESDNFLSFHDGQIDNIAYDSRNKTASVRFLMKLPCEKQFKGKLCEKIYYVFQFEGVEDFYCDIAPEYYISDLFIQQNDNRYIIHLDGIGLIFTFSKGKANRWWME